MGMDCGIIAAKKKEYLDETHYDDLLDYSEIVDNSNFYNEDEEFQWPDACEVWYARKFWDLVRNVPTLKNIDINCQYVRIKKNDLADMIKYYSFHPDYWGDFRGLPRLCELYRDYDSMAAQDVKLWFWISY